MSSLLLSLCGKREDDSRLFKAPTLTVTPRDITGTWVFLENLSEHREALQALVLEDDGTWKELENGLTGRSPASVREQGEWWLRHGVLNRLSEEHERHTNRDRQIQARVIRCDHEQMWLHGRFRSGENERILRLERSTPEHFLAHSQHAQDESRQIRKISIYLFSFLGLALLGLTTFALLK